MEGLQTENDSTQKNEFVDENISLQQQTRFHELIEGNHYEEVKKFVDENPDIHYVYDQYNKSALTKALESKKFRIYSFLRSKGFSCGVDKDYAKVYENLSNGEKVDIKFANRKFFHNSDCAHISKLFYKSRQALLSSQNNYEKIRLWFETLDKIPEISDILKLVATAETLDIVFDFNSDSVCDIDPTQTDCVKGRTIYKDIFKGIVMIGAKSEDIDILATMAHEFTHLAMHLVFADYGNPYFEKDVEEIEQFQKIIDFCRNDNEELPENQIIDNVFECYDKSEYAKELIARVPQILAYYMNDPGKLAELEEIYKNLFDYFKTYTMEMVKEEIKVAKPKQMIASLNQKFGVYKKFETYDIHSQELSISLTEVVERIENISIRSNVPDITFNDLIIKLKECGERKVESSHIFVTMDQFLNDYGLMEPVFDSSVRPKLFIIHNSGTALSTDKLTEILKFFPSRVVLITEQNLLFDNFQNIKIDHQWIDLSEHSQIHVLKQTIDFLGNKVALKMILDHDAKLLIEELDLVDILKLHKINLQQQMFELPPHFVPRAVHCFREMESMQYNETVPKELKTLEIPYSLVCGSIGGSDKMMYYWKDLPNEVFEDLLRQFKASLEKHVEPTYIFLIDMFITEKPRKLIESAYMSLKTDACEFKYLTHFQSGSITSELVKLFRANKTGSQLYHISKQKLVCDILLKDRHIQDPKDEIVKQAINLEIYFVKTSEVMPSNRSCTILTDNAGWGKTTFAIHFAKEFQQKHPTTWTVFVDLKQYTEAFEKDGTPRTTTINSDYVKRTFANLKSPIELKLFEHFYEASKVFLIFDGFDEISPNYKTFVLRVLKFVQNSGNQLLVTTRTNLAKELENALGVEAIKLMPFSKDDRKEFLNKFLKQKYPESSKDAIALKTDEVIQKIGDGDFLEVPLHHLLMTEMILEDASSQITKFNRYLLYNHFVEQKICIWVQKGHIAVKENSKLTVNFINVLQIHQKIVLESFFGLEVTEKFGLPGIAGFCTEEMICRVGLLQQLGGESLKCVHLTFAEYLIAKFLLESVERQSHLTSIDSFSHIFCSIFTESNYHFKGVRKFIDEGIIGVNTQTVSVITTQHLLTPILDSSIKENLVYIVDFILNSPEQSREVKIQMLDFVRRKLSYAVNDFESFNAVWKCICSTYKGDELKKYLFQKLEPDSQNILFCALEYNVNVNVLRFIVEDALKILTPEEFFKILQQRNIRGLTPLAKASNRKHSAFSILWNAIKVVLGDEELNKLLLDFTEDEEFWYYGPDGETAAEILETFENIFKPEDSRQLADNKQLFISVSIWFSRCSSYEMFAKFWSFIKNNFEQKAQKLIFFEKNSAGINFLSGALNNNYWSVKQMVLDIVFELFEPSEIRRVSKVTGKDFDHNNAILICIKLRHGLDYVKDFFRIPAENGRTLLHEVAEFSYNAHVARCYIEFASRNFETNDIKDMLLLEDHDSRIPLQNCRFQPYKMMFDLISVDNNFLEFWNFYRRVFGDDGVEKVLFDKSRKIFLKNNRFSNNFMHLKYSACKLFGRQKVLKAIAVARKSSQHNRGIKIYRGRYVIKRRRWFT